MNITANIQTCRRFLRLAGLECDHTGWHGCGRIGCIHYVSADQWYAAWWQK